MYMQCTLRMHVGASRDSLTTHRPSPCIRASSVAEKMNGIQIVVEVCYRLWFLFSRTYCAAVLFSLVDVSGVRSGHEQKICCASRQSGRFVVSTQPAMEWVSGPLCPGRRRQRREAGSGAGRAWNYTSTPRAPP